MSIEQVASVDMDFLRGLAKRVARAEKRGKAIVNLAMPIGRAYGLLSWASYGILQADNAAPRRERERGGGGAGD